VKVFTTIPTYPSENKSIVTIGTFDGVHLGHRVVLRRMREIAKKTKGESVLLTFSPHPRHVLYKDNQDMKLITTLQEKQDLLNQAGLDNLVIHEFTKKFSRIKPANFVRDILVEQLNVHTLVIGHDHHFGRNREGSIDELTTLADLYDFNIEKIDPQYFEDVTVSSSKIRKLIEKGEMVKAKQYLGYEFMLNGKVIKGNSLGKTINFPTANIVVENKWKILPADGVYAVKIVLEAKQYKGMMNIGQKPTVDGNGLSLEVNIFDFNQDIYGKGIEIRFVKRIRDERKFEDLQGLKKQLLIDRNKARQILI